MKKIVFLTLYCFWGLLSASAQSKGLTQKELQFRNGIERFLKQEGYVPTIDNEDNSLNWKKEGQSYWLTVQGDDPFFITLHLGGFSLSDAEEKIALEACNYTNQNKRCGKVSIDDGSVVITVEYYCHSLQNFQDTFSKYMSSIASAKEATKDYYNEHDK